MLGFNGQWMLISPVSVYDEPLLVNPTTPFFVTLIINLTNVNFQWLTLGLHYFEFSRQNISFFEWWSLVNLVNMEFSINPHLIWRV